MLQHQGFSFSVAIFLAACGLSVSTAQSDCTPVYVNSRKGELESPNFPLPYHENTCLKWMFDKEQGQVATLSFTYLDLPEDPETGECISNYVEIRSHTHRRVICGEDAAPYIAPEHLSQFTVFFYSGSRPAGHGFKISYMIGPALADYCEEGEFHCGDFGKCINNSWRCNGHWECEDHSDELRCTGAVKNRPPVAVILPDSQQVTSESTFILDGSDSRDDNGIVAYHWEMLSSPSQDHEIYDNKQTLMLSHMAPGNYVFRLTVTDRNGAINSTCANVTVIQAHPPNTTAAVARSRPTTPLPSLFNGPNQSGECHSVLRNRTGWIRHEMKRGERGPQTCSWLIQLPDTVYSITLIFKEMNLYRSDDSTAAYVVVYQGSEAEYTHSLGAFPDRAKRWSVTAHSSSMLVVFHMESASATRDLNLVCEYFSEEYSVPATTTRPTECLYRLSFSQGNFTMPPPPYNVRDIRDCKWHIYKPDRSGSDPVIHLIFTSLYLQDGAFLVVFDGSDIWAPVLSRLNGTHPVSKPVSLWSTGRDMLVEFTAPPFGYGSHPMWMQFTATYHFEEVCEESKEMRCGGGENRCYSIEQRCDGVWDCAVTGADERGCYGCRSDMFSCNDFAHNSGDRGCYSLHDRCSGGSTCRNHADESNCDANTCSEERDLFLCANKRCILYEFVCDGRDDCGDGSDEIDCKNVLSSRYIIVWAVGGSLLGGLLLVLSVGIACKVYAVRNNQVPPQPHHHHRGSRYDTPLSRLQAEMFRRRAPPPPYHEAMLTSRPYDEAVREFLAQQSQQAAAAEQESQGAEQNNSTGDTAESSERSVHNLINLMDFEEVDEHRQPLGDAQGRLEIHITGEASSDSDSEDEGEEEDGDNLAEDDSGHIEMSENLSQGRAVSSRQRADREETESILLENISQDSASATLSADSSSLTEETQQEFGKEEDRSKGSGDDGEEDDSNKDSDADSVCILCLDQDPATEDDGTDTRCLLQNV